MSGDVGEAAISSVARDDDVVARVGLGGGCDAYARGADEDEEANETSRSFWGERKVESGEG